jgi:hypothetical protein
MKWYRHFGRDAIVVLDSKIDTQSGEAIAYVAKEVITSKHPLRSAEAYFMNSSYLFWFHFPNIRIPYKTFKIDDFLYVLNSGYCDVISFQPPCVGGATVSSRGITYYTGSGNWMRYPFITRKQRQYPLRVWSVRENFFSVHCSW